MTSKHYNSLNIRQDLIYTLFVDGKKMAIGTSACFQNLIDCKGIHVHLATDEEIETLAIHQKTPFKVKQQIRDFITVRQQRRTIASTLSSARQSRQSRYLRISENPRSRNR